LLYWAAERGFANIVEQIIRVDGISPFMNEMKDKSSPFMACIKGD